jgi:hypothetical protein
MMIFVADKAFHTTIEFVHGVVLIAPGVLDR